MEWPEFRRAWPEWVSLELYGFKVQQDGLIDSTQSVGLECYMPGSHRGDILWLAGKPGWQFVLKAPVEVKSILEE